VIVINDKHLRHILKGYFRYYHESRTHLSLDEDAPESRAIQPNKSHQSVKSHRSVGFIIDTSGRLRRRDGSSYLAAYADPL